MAADDTASRSILEITYFLTCNFESWSHMFCWRFWNKNVGFAGIKSIGSFLQATILVLTMFNVQV